MLVFELINGVLELLIQYATICHYDYRIENLFVGLVVQRRQTVREPCDGIGFSRTGGMLNEVVPSRPVLLCVGHGMAHAVELMIPGENHRPPGDLPDLPVIIQNSLFRSLQVHEAPEDVEQAVALPHLSPQIGRAIAAAGRRRISGMALIPEVEG